MEVGSLAMDPSSEADRFAASWLPVVLRWCRHLGGPKVDAEDAAHDVMMVALRRADRIEPGRAAAWLFGVTRRVLARHRRTAWVRRWLPGASVPDRPDPGLGPARLAAVSVLGREIERILDTLPDGEREVLVLCLVDDRSDREAAEMLGLPHGTVKSRLRRGRARFLAAAQAAGLEPEEDA